MTTFFSICAGVALSFFFAFFGPSLAERVIPHLINAFGESIYRAQEATQSAHAVALLQAAPPEYRLSVPVIGVEPFEVGDTWGAARTEGRVHEGTDIFSSRGTYVLSPTSAVVLRVGEGDRGGNFVFTINPGGERYYYAHLDRIDPYLREGRVISEGTIIGTVGNTGNASTTPPHLHFGIYTSSGPVNPYERLIQAFGE